MKYLVNTLFDRYMPHKQLVWMILVVDNETMRRDWKVKEYTLYATILVIWYSQGLYAARWYACLMKYFAQDSPQILRGHFFFIIIQSSLCLLIFIFDDAGLSAEDQSCIINEYGRKSSDLIKKNFCGTSRKNKTTREWTPLVHREKILSWNSIWNSNIKGTFRHEKEVNDRGKFSTFYFLWILDETMINYEWLLRTKDDKTCFRIYNVNLRLFECSN